MLFTQRIIEGMGGDGRHLRARRSRWRARGSHAHHFELYDDALPTLDALRERGLKIGLLSNTARDLDEFVGHHGLDGRRGPHLARARQDEAARDDLPAHARAARTSRPSEAVMVGDTIEDDIEGARAVGMRALLVDREGRYPTRSSRLDDLRELPAALGLRA